MSTPFTHALVIGGTGMIGAHALRACLARGIRVRALARPNSDRGNLEGLGNVEIAVGDLGDPASLSTALRGCDLLIHTAGTYPARHFGKAALLARARRHLSHLLNAVQEAPELKRWVYVSSCATIGIPEGPGGEPAPHSRPARESDSRFPVPDDSPYFAVKAEMERMVMSDPERAVIVNPTLCVDELDSRLTTAQVLLPLARGMMPAYLPGQLNAVPTRDVGEGILLAAERGRCGERYILGAENMSCRDFLARCARIAGVSAPRFALPFFIAEAASLATEVWARATGTAPLFPMAGVRMMKHSQTYDTSKAREELGFRPFAVDDAIERAFTWYRTQGLL